MVYRANENLLQAESEIFSSKLLEDYKSKAYLADEHVYAKHFSLLKWFEMNEHLF